MLLFNNSINCDSTLGFFSAKLGVISIHILLIGNVFFHSVAYKFSMHWPLGGVLYSFIFFSRFPLLVENKKTEFPVLF